MRGQNHVRFTLVWFNMASVDIVAIAGFVVDDEEAVDQQLQFLLHSESYIDNMWTPIPLLFSASLFR